MHPEAPLPVTEFTSVTHRQAPAVRPGLSRCSCVLSRGTLGPVNLSSLNLVLVLGDRCVLCVGHLHLSSWNLVLVLGGSVRRSKGALVGHVDLSSWDLLGGEGWLVRAGWYRVSRAGSRVVLGSGQCGRRCRRRRRRCCRRRGS